MIIENLLKGKNIEESIELLKKMKLRILKNEIEVPELDFKKDLLETYHGADKYFKMTLNSNRRKLKEVFKGEDFVKAVDFLKAESGLKYLCTKIDEALGIRDLAMNNFKTYSLQAFKLGTTFGKDSLVQKYNFFSPVYKLTNSHGFNETQNEFKEDILIRGRRLLQTVLDTGSYSEEDSIIKLVDDSSGNEMTVKLACNLININKKCM